MPNINKKRHKAMTDAEIALVEQIKFEMGKGWWKYLEEKTGRSSVFLSKMVNALETHRPEWLHVINRIEEQKAIRLKNKQATERLLSAETI